MLGLKNYVHEYCKLILDLYKWLPTAKGKENVTDRHEHKYEHQLSDASSRISFIYEKF